MSYVLVLPRILLYYRIIVCRGCLTGLYWPVITFCCQLLYQLWHNRGVVRDNRKFSEDDLLIEGDTYFWTKDTSENKLVMEKINCSQSSDSEKSIAGCKIEKQLQGE